MDESMWIYKSHQGIPSQAELALYLFFFMDLKPKHYELTCPNDVLALQGYSRRHCNITRAKCAE